MQRFEMTAHRRLWKLHALRNFAYAELFTLKQSKHPDSDEIAKDREECEKCRRSVWHHACEDFDGTSIDQSIGGSPVVNSAAMPYSARRASTIWFFASIVNA